MSPPSPHLILYFGTDPAFYISTCHQTCSLISFLITTLLCAVHSSPTSSSNFSALFFSVLFCTLTSFPLLLPTLLLINMLNSQRKYLLPRLILKPCFFCHDSWREYLFFLLCPPGGRDPTGPSPSSPSLVSSRSPSLAWVSSGLQRAPPPVYSSRSRLCPIRETTRSGPASDRVGHSSCFWFWHQRGHLPGANSRFH